MRHGSARMPQIALRAVIICSLWGVATSAQSSPSSKQGAANRVPAALEAAPQGAISSLKAVRELISKARQRYNEGVLEQSREKLEGSLDALILAYTLAPQPELLLNMAQVERRLGRCEQARATYESYLKSNPTPQGRAVAEHNLESLERCEVEGQASAEVGPVVILPEPIRLAAEQPAIDWDPIPSSVEPMGPSSAKEPGFRNGAPWFLAGAASISAIVAGVFWARSLDAHEDFARTGDADRLEVLRERGEAAQETAIVLGTAAVALGAGGVTLFVLQLPSQAQETSPLGMSGIEPRREPRLGLGLRSAGVQWRF